MGSLTFFSFDVMLVPRASIIAYDPIGRSMSRLRVVFGSRGISAGGVPHFFWHESRVGLLGGRRTAFSFDFGDILKVVLRR